jgi:hypothetical protein
MEEGGMSPASRIYAAAVQQAMQGQEGEVNRFFNPGTTASLRNLLRGITLPSYYYTSCLSACWFKA